MKDDRIMRLIDNVIDVAESAGENALAGILCFVQVAMDVDESTGNTLQRMAEVCEKVAEQGMKDAITLENLPQETVQ